MDQLTLKRYEAKAQAMRRKIHTMALNENVEPEVMAMAIADVLADIAVGLDRTHGHVPFDVRLRAILEQSQLTYGRLSHLSANILLARGRG